MTTILDLLDNGAGSPALLRFPSDGDLAVPFSDVWRRSAEAADRLSARFAEGEPVAMVLTPSPDVIAALLGGWRAGLRMASLPQPGRGMNLSDYRDQVEAMCRQVGARTLLVEQRYVPFIPADLSVEVQGVEQLGAAAAAGRRESAAGSFVQFTSGSTSDPKGVVLSLEAIAANVSALLRMTEPAPGDAVVSWLPLSHDMGLIGTLLTGLAALSPEWAGDGDIALIRPETFLQSPGVWLDTCSALHATHTAAPSFAFELAARGLRTGQSRRLDRLRMVITGAEMVRADVLRRFAEAAAPHGFDSTALTPAYGLAEATLAVTMVGPKEHWTSAVVEGGRLASGEWVPVDSPVDAPGAAARPLELVGCGTPIPGMSVRVTGTDGGVGVVEVSGPSLCSGYANGQSARDADGWLRTGDQGVLVGGDLYITGRVDDLLVVGGRNLYAYELETTALSCGVVRHGNVVALDDDRGRYLVVAELARDVPADADLREAARVMRRELVRRHQLGPSSVRFVPPGSLPKTPSGKAQRHRVLRALRGGELDEVATVAFGRE